MRSWIGKKRVTVILVVAVVAVALLIAVFWRPLVNVMTRPGNPSVPSGTAAVDDGAVVTVAENLSTPWAMSRLPDGDLLATMRNGQLQRIGDNGRTFIIEGVEETSEGGLLGLAIHPEFNRNGWIYLYSTTENSGRLTNRIERYTLSGDSLSDKTDIVSGIPASANHDGGALAFGPDGKLYATTGDANVQQSAQDTTSLAGKILRMNDDGKAPDDNPFDNLVWSYGHRNSQGITWDDKGRMWSTEHGPSGGDTGRDELNLIARAGNYGWPEVTGDERREGIIAPIAQSGDDDTWAPGGIAYHDGAVYFTGLRGQSLYKAVINDDATVRLSRNLTSEYGRLRAVMSDGDSLIISTSNRDGRGAPATTDDRLLSIKFSSFD